MCGRVLANTMADQPEGEQLDRRGFVHTGSQAVMAIGLCAGYGTLAAMAGRYLYPEGDDDEWLFVSDAASISFGVAAVDFESPSGVRVAVTRVREAKDGAADRAENFLALSSICPHLGCRVHWEPQNDRFFCPCHNGVFDRSGAPVSGPPAAADQALPTYRLQMVDGALYIRMPAAGLRSQA